MSRSVFLLEETGFEVRAGTIASTKKSYKLLFIYLTEKKVDNIVIVFHQNP
jgi:hypothetical protein